MTDYTIYPEKISTIRARNKVIMRLRNLEISRRESAESILLRVVELYEKYMEKKNGKK